MLIKFWSDHATYGFHPDDIPYIPNDLILDWSIDDALAHRDAFENNLKLFKKDPKLYKKNAKLHRMLHVNLFPYPFVGNIEHASVVILFGNPGFAPTDYLDEHCNPTHMQACIDNISGRAKSFFVLERDSKGTGGYDYWRPRFKTLVGELANELSIKRNEAFRIATRNIALIEAGAYHSKSNPGQWLDNLPSSQIAREFVHQKLLPRAREREILIFVWRRASHWDIQSKLPGVIVRPTNQARLSHLNEKERTAIVKQIRDNLI